MNCLEESHFSSFYRFPELSLGIETEIKIEPTVTNMGQLNER